MKVGEDAKDQFAPLFKAKLWKVKAEGDRKKADDWFEREMWIAKNGASEGLGETKLLLEAALSTGVRRKTASWQLSRSFGVDTARRLGH